MRTDVQAAYGEKYDNTESSGFIIHGRSETEEIDLNIVTKEGKIISKVTDSHMESEEFILCIDSVMVQNITEELTEKGSAVSIVLARWILKFYQMTTPVLFVIAIIVFVGVIIIDMFDVIQKKISYFKDYEIIVPATGILLSVLVLHFGVSINYFDAWNKDIQSFCYLGGSYPLQLGFVLLMIILMVNKCKLGK